MTLVGLLYLLAACNSSSAGKTATADCDQTASCAEQPVPEPVSDQSPTDNSEWPFTYEPETVPAPPPPPPEQQFPAAVPVFEGATAPPLPAHAGGNSAPPYLIAIQLPGFETWLTRISDNDVFGLSNGQAIHLYSKHQAWNADETLLDVGNHVLDAQTFEIVSSIPLSTARSWSNVYPELMFGIRYNSDERSLNILAGYDLATDQVTNLKVFGGYQDCSFGNQEGSLSANDRYIVVSCTDSNRGQQVLLSYDIQHQEILGQIDAADNYNWASVSPSGHYIVVENNRFPEENPHLLRYDLRFGGQHNLGAPAHGDFGYNDVGEEVYVMINNDRFYYVRLSDGLRVDITLESGNYPAGHGHISCRNTWRPGWCYFSSRNTGRVGAIRVSASAGLIEPWGYHFSTSSSYAAAPKATVNRSGTQVLFSSDWQGTAQISDYVLDVRDR